jgi:prolyl-tRNA synthetase
MKESRRVRLSRLFGTTLREAPAGAEAASHALLARAGFIRQLGQGLYSYLPLARRSMTLIENIIRREMNAIGGQELTMPVVLPAEIWKTTGRWRSIGPEMARFKDRRDRDMVLAMTHEEVVADLCRTEIRSYKHLPRLVYHIQTKFRDDPRPRAGLIRVREFTMKDSYSLDADEAGLDVQYRSHYQAYFDIFAHCGLPVTAVGSDVGMMGGSMAHEYMYLAPVGEDTIAVCRACGYAANRQVALFAKTPAPPEAPKTLEKIATPDCRTIEELAALLGIPRRKTAKAVFMTAGAGHDDARGRFVFAVIRGDMEVNETKLVNALSAAWLRPATEEEIRAAGAVPGFASPIGIPRGEGTVVIVDDAVRDSPNLVAGANIEGFHVLNTNTPRDFQADIVTDIASASEGSACVKCGAPLSMKRGVEVGNIFKLGTRYTQAMGASYLDADGNEKPVVMGSYGIGIGRLLACIAEEHHDDKGLIWPITVSPFPVHLVSLAPPGSQALNAAERACSALEAAGVEVLFDDRAESPGVKFADADLIGIPIRLTVSDKSLKAGGVELKLRKAADRTVIPEDKLVDRVKAEMDGLRAEIQFPARSAARGLDS